MDKILYYPVIDEKRAKWKKLIEKIKSWFFKNIVSDIDKANAILVGWWDGFMIHTIKKYFDNGKLFFGLNCGTLWFLLNDFGSELPKKKQDIDIVRWHCVKVEVFTNWGKKYNLYAVNDIVIGWNILDYFSFDIQSQDFSKRVKWTGLIISTVLWSSWYWLSNGWPIMPMTSNLLGIMWIATKPFNYHLIKYQNIKITPIGRTPFLVWIDWYSGKIENVKEVVISPSTKYVDLWFIKDYDFDSKRINLSNHKLSWISTI